MIEQRTCPHCGETHAVCEDHLPICRRYDDEVWYGCTSCGREAFKASYAATRSASWDDATKVIRGKGAPETIIEVSWREEAA